MITVYHNPRCSKSRACLELLEKSGKPLEIINYLNQPLSLAQLKEFVSQLGIKAIVRDNEALFTELRLAKADDDTIFQAILSHPQLLQRPIVVRGKRIIVARPPEKVLELLNE